MKTPRIHAAVLVALISSTFVPRITLAQDDPVTTQARTRFKEGVDAYDKGQYENARLAFLQAYALKKHPAVLLNLAQSSAKAGHPLEASKYFQQFLKESTTATPQQRGDAESGLAEVRQKLGRIEISAPGGTEITLDEKDRLGTAPFAEPVDVDPGSHSLRSSTETVRVTATAGQRVPARFGAAPAGGVAVAPVPGGGPTTTPAATEPAGPPASGGSRPKHTNALSPPANMTPVIVGLAVAGAGLASTIVFAAFKADAQQKADGVAQQIRTAAIKAGFDSNGDGIADANNVCGTTLQPFKTNFAAACNTLTDNNNKVNTNATIANVSAVVMIAGLATAAGWYLFAPKRDDSRSYTGKPSAPVLTPYAGYGSGGFTLHAEF